jgi:hypothetical protein
VLPYLYHSKELSLNIGSRHPVQIIAYSDASPGTAPRGRSVGSTCIQLALDSGCILAKARTTTATILSSFEAELDSITTTIKYVFRINNILQELQVVMHNNPIIYTDNDATIDFAYNKNISKNVRHIELRMWYIGDHLLAGKFDLLFMRMAFTFIFRNPNLSFVLGFTKLQIMKLWGEIFYWSIHVLNLKPCPNEPTKEIRVFTKFRGDSDRFWEVIRALYGLKTSPKDYQDHVARRLIALGFTRLTLCSCIYSLRKGDKVVLIYVFVDDFIFASSDYDALLTSFDR